MSDIKKIVHNFWYQKVIFWYQKFNHFLISEINFWYQKIIFWYQKISIKVLFGVPCDSNVCTWSQGSHYAKRISSYNQCENHVLGWTWTLELFFHSGGKIFLQRERSMISLVNMPIIWYQKMIFWYQKIDFLISEIIFWYQKIGISDIRK